MQNIPILTSQLDEFLVLVIIDCNVIDKLLPAVRGKVGEYSGRLPDLFSDLKRVCSSVNIKALCVL
jgi:hypothetical protein